MEENGIETFVYRKTEGTCVKEDETETKLLLISTKEIPLRDEGIRVGDLEAILENISAQTEIILDPPIEPLSLSDLIHYILFDRVRFIDDATKEIIRGKIFVGNDDWIIQNKLKAMDFERLEGSVLEQSWFGIICQVPNISQAVITITRLSEPTEFGEHGNQTQFIILIVTPEIETGDNKALELARIFGTLFCIPELRENLLEVKTTDDFITELCQFAKSLQQPGRKFSHAVQDNESFDQVSIFQPGRGIFNDIRRRLPHYISDYTDGIKDWRAFQKVLSTSAWMYFACILPTIAFAMVNDKTTQGIIGVKKGIFTQAIAQILYSLFSGQHLCVVLTTAPLCLFVRILFEVSDYLNVQDQFPAFYCAVGLWCSFFLITSAIFNVSKIMKWCTNSTEEIFALFISIAFVVYAAKDITHNFQDNYVHSHNNFSISENNSTGQDIFGEIVAERDKSLLYLLLSLGTAWFGLLLHGFRNTPYLNASKREIIADYALPIAVLSGSFVGSKVFSDIHASTFGYDTNQPYLTLAPIENLPWSVILFAAILGFSLFILIFMDENIGGSIVNSPSNKLKKGPSYHYDILVIGIINVFCSLFTLPFIHVALPHAPMHVKNLADIECRVENGRIIQTVIRVRETRITGLISHIGMGLSLLLLPYPLSYIPPSVFDGLFLFMGLTALEGNHFFERILLIFTEKASYPATSYIRKVPRRTMHLFTLIQVLQLGVLCFLGFFPYPFLKLLFPLVLLVLLFVRQTVLPKVIDEKYLNLLD